LRWPTSKSVSPKFEIAAERGLSRAKTEAAKKENGEGSMIIATFAWRSARRAVREPTGLVIAGMIALAIALFAVSARAAFPDRPVRLIVPFAPAT
jgi:hypothetical protein